MVDIVVFGYFGYVVVVDVVVVGVGLYDEVVVVDGGVEVDCLVDVVGFVVV